jgi:3-phosphoshikimate 1-carboxyvinyltransferase
MSTLVVRGPTAIDGRPAIPGDKSISHRALMLAAVAEGECAITNLGPGEDIASTAECLRAYGVSVDGKNGTTRVRGEGIGSWAEPDVVLDCGNSGTTMRILAGFAAHNPFTSVLDGDDSLRRRPMDRLVKPLGALGVRVRTTAGHAPLYIAGGKLAGTEVELSVPTAQVKSAVIFAALAAEGRTTVTEPSRSRDHTERFLTALGAPIDVSDLPDGRRRVEISAFAPARFEIEIPGDPSSAAFIVTAAVLTGSAEIPNVGLNPTRIGFLETLARMGAAVEWKTEAEHMGEPVGTISARASELASTGLEGPLVPLVLDELPLLAVLATQARGTTTVTGAAELRIKESDRIATIVTALRDMGADAEEKRDGFTVSGPTPLKGTTVDPAGDHRIAMALAVAGLVADGETVIDGFEAASVSWPGFDGVLASLGADVELQ